MTGLPSDRESDQPIPRSERNSDSCCRDGARHRRALRGGAFRVRRLSLRQPVRRAGRYRATARDIPNGTRPVETADGPRATREAGYSWSKGDEWKRLIFTEEQPFQDKEAKAEWEARNNEYRRLKAEGKI